MLGFWIDVVREWDRIPIMIPFRVSFSSRWEWEMMNDPTLVLTSGYIPTAQR